ncbi:MAG: dienelactone hydrolase family protein, partial [Planctomycetales bacterium]|nr:dienelactone hydrolase family protein [Planctomycetales bacterium]
MIRHALLAVGLCLYVVNCPLVADEPAGIQMTDRQAADKQATNSEPARPRSLPPVIESSWDDLTAGIDSPEDWAQRREVLRARFLELIRDGEKPARVPLDLTVHETTVVDGVYERRLVSYQTEADDRAHAYLGVPLGTPQELGCGERFPAVVALHGTFDQGMRRAAGLADNPDKAYLDHLCRRGYVVIAPEHFVSGTRIPAEGAYDTTAFHQKHPRWTAVGKFTYEHSIAVDVLETLDAVDPARIGALGHSLVGLDTIFLAAYDERIQAAACNCGASFFRHNAAVEAWSRDHWYVYFKHIRPELLAGRLPPIDFHEIIALVAPRAFL